MHGNRPALRRVTGDRAEGGRETGDVRLRRAVEVASVRPLRCRNERRLVVDRIRIYECADDPRGAVDPRHRRRTRIAHRGVSRERLRRSEWPLWTTTRHAAWARLTGEWLHERKLNSDVEKRVSTRHPIDAHHRAVTEDSATPEGRLVRDRRSDIAGARPPLGTEANGECRGSHLRAESTVRSPISTFRHQLTGRGEQASERIEEWSLDCQQCRGTASFPADDADARSRESPLWRLSHREDWRRRLCQ